LLDKWKSPQPPPGKPANPWVWLANAGLYYVYALAGFFSVLAELALVERLWLIGGLLLVAVGLYWGYALAAAAMSREGWYLRTRVSCGTILVRPWKVCPACGGTPQ
jgi:hypothetical protein